MNKGRFPWLASEVYMVAQKISPVIPQN